MRIERSFDHRKKCPDIQYTQFSYDEYGGFDVKIIAQNQTFFAHRWAQNQTFFAHRWSSWNTKYKIIHNYVDQNLPNYKIVYKMMARKFILFITSIHTNIYLYFLRLLLSAGSSLLKSILLVRIVFTWLFFMFKVTECQFYIIWAVMLDI